MTAPVWHTKLNFSNDHIKYIYKNYVHEESAMFIFVWGCTLYAVKRHYQFYHTLRH